jgi:hypothetical protein
MSEMHIRQARLDDTQSISELFRAEIPVWQRMDERGQVEDRPYEGLTIYERWLHGGPWMSVETGAIYLSHLLRGAGITLVAEADGHILGYAEAYLGSEPTPFGRHLHLAYLRARADRAEAVKSELIERLRVLARERRCERFTVGFSHYDHAAAEFYSDFGMQCLARIGSYVLSAQTGQSFYKTTEHPTADPQQIDGWHMTVGRVESARQHWETLWPRLWDAIEEIATRETHRLHFSAAGQEAFLCCQQQLYDLRSADIYCWSPKPLTTQLLTAIRDWAHRSGYRQLIFAVPEATVKLLGPSAEATPYQQDIYAVDL